MLRHLAALVFPARCPGCGRPAEPVCAACAAGLVPPRPAPPPAGIDAWVAVFAYQGVARELVARAKYRREWASLPWLAAHMARAASTLPVAFDACTWVPTTVARRRARGFDHAEVLARALDLAIPVRRLLGREPGPPQTGRSGRDRRAGPAFRVVARRVPGRVLLVDDVTTTGATLAAGARALRARGVHVVAAVTAARTPRAPVAP